jgi:hypothetical protein
VQQCARFCAHAGSLNIDARTFEWGGVAPNPPSITSINPANGYRGQAVPVTIAGTNLAGVTPVAVTSGITVGALTTTATTLSPQQGAISFSAPSPHVGAGNC